MTKLRLRSTDVRLLDLPWERPLGDWDPALFVALEPGPSRNLVRFFDGDDGRYALKELDARWAEREWRVLRRCVDAGVPVVPAIGLVERDDGLSIIITRAVEGVDSYRQILASSFDEALIDSLIDALALLLVELHRAGIYWGDATLANTLLSRDGDGMVAILVDGETGEVHPGGLSDGQRSEDLALCVERVAHGLVDIAAAHHLTDDDRFIALAERIDQRYRELWQELTEPTQIASGDTHALDRRIRRLEGLGFTVREIQLRSGDTGVELRVATGRRRASAERLERLTGVRAREGQARILLADLDLHRAWLSALRGHDVELAEAAIHWRAERFEPTIAQIAPVLRSEEEPVQAFCELIDRKWRASEPLGRDVGLRSSIALWLAARAERA